MCGSGRRATFTVTPASRRSRTRNTPRCSLDRSTRCFAAARGPRVPAPSATHSATGIIPFAGRSSAAFGARAMTSVRLPAVPLPRDAAPSIARGYESRAREAMLADVRVGLSHRQKELSPKYFYDHRGSELFEEITTLPEYYLTRSERALLRRDTGSIVGALRPRTLVELGAGSASKTRLIL